MLLKKIKYKVVNDIKNINNINGEIRENLIIHKNISGCNQLKINIF
jgi:hypothetical protein